MVASSTAALAGSAIISAAELRRITGSLTVDEVAQDHLRKLELQKKSKARVNKWTNTLEGSRRQKQKMRAERFEREEKERQKIDAEEAAVQQEIRKNILDKANHQIFNECDRIKTFHSMMMFSDVIAEREAQMELKEELKKLELQREERFKELDRENYQKSLDREIREKKELEDRTAEQVRCQQEQREIKAARAREEKDRYEKEGMMIRLKAVEDLAMEKKVEENRKRLEKQTFMSSLKILEYNKHIKEKEKERFEREDEKIKEYAAHKDLMQEKRKQRDKELKEDKLMHQQRMIDRQAAILLELQNKDEERTENQVKEKDEAERIKAEQKAAFLGNMEWDIKQSRREDIERKQIQRMKNIHEQLELKADWDQRIDKLNKDDKEKVENKNKKLRELQQDHIKQAELKRRKAKEERRAGDKNLKSAKRGLEQEDLDFHKYAEQVIKEYAEDGKNIIPIVRNLKEYHTKNQLG